LKVVVICVLKSGVYNLYGKVGNRVVPLVSFEDESPIHLEKIKRYDIKKVWIRSVYGDDRAV
jgi:hypothetical protein